MNSPPPSAGWYADPWNPGAWRWWDGTNWTGHQSGATGSAGTPPAASAPEVPPATGPAVALPPRPVSVGPSPAALAAVDPDLIRPRQRMYWLSSIPFVLGLIGAIILGISAADKGVSGFDRLTTSPTDFNAPGSTTVHLSDRAGGAIYVQTARNRIEMTGPSAADVTCKVRAPNGSFLSVSGEGDVFTLTNNGDSYRAIYRFPVDRPGDYAVSCVLTGQGKGPAALAVGPRVAATDVLSFFGRAGGAILSLMLGAGLSALFAALVAMARRRSRTRLAAADQTQGSSSPA